MSKDNDKEIRKLTPDAEADAEKKENGVPAAEEPGAKAGPETEEEPEKAGEEAAESRKSGGEFGTKVKEYTQSTRFRRGGISTAFTAGFLVVVVLINIIVSVLAQRYPSMNVDLTKNKVNTLSTYSHPTIYTMVYSTKFINYICMKQIRMIWLWLKILTKDYHIALVFQT